LNGIDKKLFFSKKAKPKAKKLLIVRFEKTVFLGKREKYA
jgi:hypothetical protein